MAAQRIARAEEQVEEGLKEWDPAKDPEAAVRSQALQGFLTLVLLPRLHAVHLHEVGHVQQAQGRDAHCGLWKLLWCASPVASATDCSVEHG